MFLDGVIEEVRQESRDKYPYVLNWKEREIVKKRLRKLLEYVRKIREESFNDGCAKEIRRPEEIDLGSFYLQGL
ncbi:hypothetical protein FHEFKHOI_00351 [Candidatus Methanoperedenaceae archaeon GB50]|nr:hypothetical protein FHEFKHOI_00351 [Candidatus Methanoperedenaceae archaeon GB50]CAD7779109.1 MAG: hypothetical protein KBONHNOK_01249 [Candidatus Methanoperedenaceae archaeon GB50]